MKKQKLKLIALISAMAMLLTACAENHSAKQPDESTTPDTSLSEKPETTPDSDVNGTNDTGNDRVYKEDSGFPYAVPDDVKITYEFTEEDKELHEILESLDPAWTVFVTLRRDGYGIYEADHDIIKTVFLVFPQKEKPYEEYYLLMPDGRLPFNTIDEMKTEIRKYFSEAVALEFLGHLRSAKGKFLLEEDGIYEVSLSPDEYGYFDDNGFLYYSPLILELDGKFYRGEDIWTGLKGIDYNATRILSRTDDEIIFAYLIPAMHEEHTMVTGKAALKYEDGWKYDWNLEYPGDDDFLDFYEVWR